MTEEDEGLPVSPRWPPLLRRCPVVGGVVVDFVMIVAVNA
jgi:hypothetical protein